MLSRVLVYLYIIPPSGSRDGMDWPAAGPPRERKVACEKFVTSEILGPKWQRGRKRGVVKDEDDALRVVTVYSLLFYHSQCSVFTFSSDSTTRSSGIGALIPRSRTPV